MRDRPMSIVRVLAVRVAMAAIHGATASDSKPRPDLAGHCRVMRLAHSGAGRDATLTMQ